jgi:septum formation protein
VSLLQAPTPPLLLASASAARRALLERAGLCYDVQVARIDEAEVKRSARAEGVSADVAALLLADLKAGQVGRSHPEALVIGCDQLLVCGADWFDKPGDLAGARAQLQALRGQSHVLVTGVVCHRHGGRIWHHVAHPRLTMRDMSDAFLEAYLAAEGEALIGTVGAYRLEGLGVHLFEAVEGEYAAVLGLPLLALLGFLRQHGVLGR